MIPLVKQTLKNCDMRPSHDSRLTYIILGFFFLAVLGYALYEAQGILFGPSISVVSQHAEVGEPYTLIKGQADRIVSLTMNGKPIPVTESGAFEEPFLLAPWYNMIVLDAVDRYGRKSSKEVEIIYTTPTSYKLHNEGLATSTPDEGAPLPVGGAEASTSQRVAE